MGNIFEPILADGFTPRNLLMMAGIAAIILFSISSIKSIVKRRGSPHVQAVACGCGWRGNVSRYAGRCPQCNRPLGDQEAQPKK